MGEYALNGLEPQEPRVAPRWPSTASEIYLAALWKETLGIGGDVMLDNRFLDVGGNSLTLNLILTRIETEKRVSMEPEAFFEPERSSLFDLARELDRLLELK